MLSSELRPLVGRLLASATASLHAYSSVQHFDFHNIDYYDYCYDDDDYYYYYTLSIIIMQMKQMS